MPVPTVADVDGMTPNGALTDEIVREGAGRMLAAALEGGVSIYLAQLAGQRDEAGRRLVVRNGYQGAVNAPRLVALVRAGARFERGVPAGRDTAVGAWTTSTPLWPSPTVWGMPPTRSRCATSRPGTPPGAPRATAVPSAPPTSRSSSPYAPRSCANAPATPSRAKSSV